MPIITGISPDGHSGASKRSTASFAALRIPFDKSCLSKISKPILSPGENLPVWNDLPSLAVTTPMILVLTLFSLTITSSELKTQTSSSNSFNPTLTSITFSE